MIVVLSESDTQLSKMHSFEYTNDTNNDLSSSL